MLGMEQYILGNIMLWSFVIHRDWAFLGKQSETKIHRWTVISGLQKKNFQKTGDKSIVGVQNVIYDPFYEKPSDYEIMRGGN